MALVTSGVVTWVLPADLTAHRWMKHLASLAHLTPLGTAWPLRGAGTEAVGMMPMPVQTRAESGIGQWDRTDLHPEPSGAKQECCMSGHYMSSS